MNAIELINLTKKFGDLIAVDHLNLTISQGEIFGFLGPNGAGKTTTLKILTGLMRATEGKTLIHGIDIQLEPMKAKQLFGFIPDSPFIYEKLTANEFMQFIADIYDIDRKWATNRIKELLSLFELTNWQDELIEGYSHGMRQRLVIASTLLHEPKILIIDEPMVGLDPKGVRLVKEVLKNVSNKGTTILLSTHSMEIAEKLCNRIGIIQQGKLIALGSLQELRECAKTTSQHLEDIFLNLTNAADYAEIVNYL